MVNSVMRLLSMVWNAVDSVRKLLHLFFLLLLTAVFISAISGTGPQVLPADTALTIRPSGQLVDQLQGDAYDRAIEELMDQPRLQTLVGDVVDALNYAASDDRINAVHLELSGLGGGGMSKLERIAAAMENFRGSGKPLIASADFMSQGALFLAAHADEVYMHPEGLVLLQGFGRYRNYFADAIEKLRLDWNIFRVGTHKSYVEPFTRMDMSPEDRESTTRLIGQLWTRYTSRIESERELEAGSLQDYVDNFAGAIEAAGGDPAVAAVANGLVDDLLTHVELDELMRSHVATAEDGTYRRVEMGDYLPQMRMMDTDVVRSDNVALIVAAGEILVGEQPPGTIGAESVAALLHEAKEDDSIRAVVLQVDSPGGSAFASDIIANAIEEVQVSGKPVIVSMSSTAASGGYWISAGADRILASPVTITGSIGIFGMFPTYQRAADYLGIATDGVGTTALAGQFRPDREMSDDAKQLFQLIIEDGYDDFISRVAEYRSMDKDAVDAIAQGRVWTGQDALERGLVDELGTLEDAIATAADIAGLDADAYGIVRLEKGLSPAEQFVVDLLSATARVGISPSLFVSRPTTLQSLAGEIERLLEPLASFNDPKGLYSHCFCELE